MVKWRLHLSIFIMFSVIKQPATDSADSGLQKPCWRPTVRYVMVVFTGDKAMASGYLLLPLMTNNASTRKI